MTFIVTARKWRPQLFDDVVGQQHITQTLKNAIENNRIGHAYIFAGPRGVGKTTTARILAKRLNCQSPNGGEPCNKCDACNNFLKSQSLDIIEIDGASNRRIDEIRTLRESVKYAPTSGEYKVYIIDEVHMLTIESFNALLKTLEEPPEHTIFIFATTDIHKVPLTIISRCQRFDFRRIELIDIKNLLRKISLEEKIEIDDESLTLIAKKADGALRDAESIFDQVVSFCGTEITANDLRQMLNLIDEDIYFDLSDSIISKNFKSAFEISNKIYANGWNFVDFINGLIEHFRNILFVETTKTSEMIETTENQRKKYDKYIGVFSEGDLLRILKFLSQTQQDLRFSQNQKLTIEIALSHLIGIERSSTITELIKIIKDSDFDQKFDNYNIVKDSINSSTNKSSENAQNLTYAESNTTLEKKIDNVSKSISDIKTLPLVEEQSQLISLDEIIKNWNYFINVITTERFTLGSLLDNSSPKSLVKNKLKVEVENSEDTSILNNSADFLSKKLSSIFNYNIKLEFNSEKNTTKGLNLNSNQNNANKITENSPLIEKIINQLGGREIK